MAATASPPFDKLLAQLQLTVSDAQLQPGEVAAASGSGLPARGFTATIEWSVQSLPDGQPLTAGVGFLAPRGLKGTRADFRFRPEVVEHLATAPAPLRRRIRATVKLSAGHASAKRALE